MRNVNNIKNAHFATKRRRSLYDRFPEACRKDAGMTDLRKRQIAFGNWVICGSSFTLTPPPQN